MDNYDRIVAFMNGQDPNEVQTSKTRNLITSILSFVFVVGAFVIICWLSIYLSFKFYRNQLKDLEAEMLLGFKNFTLNFAHRVFFYRIIIHYLNLQTLLLIMIYLY